MTDPNRIALMTEHIHLHPTGTLLVCPPLKERFAKVFTDGFEHGEILLKMLPDGTLDYTEAMCLFWRPGSNAARLVDC